MGQPDERDDSLWWLAVSPSIWAVHLLASYITVAIWCAKGGATLAPVRVAVIVYTAVALLGVAATGARAWRRHRTGFATVPHDFDTRADRRRFLGFATLLLSGLSFIAIVFGAMPFAVIGSCR